MHKLVLARKNDERETLDFDDYEEMHRKALDYVAEHPDFYLSGDLPNSSGGRSIIVIQKYVKEN